MTDVFAPASLDLGIQNLHMISGEDIVGHTFLETDTVTGIQTYRVEQPVVPTMSQDPNTGAWRVGLLPLRPYLDKTDKVELLSGHIMYVTPVGERFRAMYAQFNSNIIVAAPGSLNQILSQ
jgi:hypothetical protein